jgi:beta-lactamase class A
VRHLASGREAAIRADELFPTASMIKVPIMLGLFQRLEEGSLGFRDTLIYADSLAYDKEDDLLAKLKDSAHVPLNQVALLMITTSDNTASLWLQHKAGSGTAINAWLSDHGFDSTRVNSRTPGREGDRSRFGWGQTTPREMAELLVRIRQQRAVSPAADQEMYRTSRTRAGRRRTRDTCCCGRCRRCCGRPSSRTIHGNPPRAPTATSRSSGVEGGGGGRYEACGVEGDP